MNTEANFITLQREFTRYLRDPDQHSPPGQHEQRRLSIYRHAIYANVEGLMSDNYPRIRAITDDDSWSTMVRDYIIQHQASSSAFVDVPGEFYRYLEHERRNHSDPPFLLELAHFDWLETLVGADERQIDRHGIDLSGNLLECVPIANPVMRLVSYRFPVHAIDANYLPDQAPQKRTHIAAFRDPDNRYGFLDLSEAAAQLLSAIVDNSAQTGKQLIAALAIQLGYSEPQELQQPALAMLERMRQRGAILGTKAD